MAKQKFYVVWEGHTPGVYSSWDDCKRQVDGYNGAKYKSFEHKAEAEAALKTNYWKFIQKSDPAAKTASKPAPRSSIIKESVSVDAACSGNPG
ncbi:MAG: RNase H1/viroplasmin domain-containing protein, partial [Blastocatellia bacterium]|nr:RNase H1/viroplasmin domain-containing protein [Blastocatellia bacterium]